jgi:hypothetical protein
LALIRKNIFLTLQGDDWIGVRVRASTHRLQYGNNNSQNRSLACEQVRCQGTIVSYCAGINKHFIVFDEPLLKPKWVTCTSSEIDVLIGPTEVAKSNHTNQLMQPEFRIATKDRGSCFLCGYSLHFIQQKTALDTITNPSHIKRDFTDDNATESSSQIQANMSDQSDVSQKLSNEQSLEGVVGHRKKKVDDNIHNTVQAEPVYGVGKRKRRNIFIEKYCEMPSLFESDGKVVLMEKETTKKKSILENESLPSLQQCLHCQYYFHSYCMPYSVIKSLVDDYELFPDDKSWICWFCLQCQGGCGSSLWNHEMLLWTSQRLHTKNENEFDHNTLKPTCGYCMDKYINGQEYCPICYKFYPDEQILKNPRSLSNLRFQYLPSCRPDEICLRSNQCNEFVQVNYKQANGNDNLISNDNFNLNSLYGHYETVDDTCGDETVPIDTKKKKKKRKNTSEPRNPKKKSTQRNNPLVSEINVIDDNECIDPIDNGGDMDDNNSSNGDEIITSGERNEIISNEHMDVEMSTCHDGIVEERNGSAEDAQEQMDCNQKHDNVGNQIADSESSLQDDKHTKENVIHNVDEKAQKSRDDCDDRECRASDFEGLVEDSMVR